jgi:hypothetical protein
MVNEALVGCIGFIFGAPKMGCEKKLKEICPVAMTNSNLT